MQGPRLGAAQRSQALALATFFAGIFSLAGFSLRCCSTCQPQLDPGHDTSGNSNLFSLDVPVYGSSGSSNRLHGRFDRAIDVRAPRSFDGRCEFTRGEPCVFAREEHSWKVAGRIDVDVGVVERCFVVSLLCSVWSCAYRGTICGRRTLRRGRRRCTAPSPIGA